ncbi:hypothetical protein B0H16DRAFT_1733858 [Mycena metata]|uniref:Uncharacterized protein n=1 Tax=Mycena metata TaxID=1033252 RepID=A0AAD7HX71_9AGAR|nr:hypothetical protein B0H16DRAFT_1733858 [Mycena metata]
MSSSKKLDYLPDAFLASLAPLARLSGKVKLTVLLRSLTLGLLVLRDSLLGQLASDTCTSTNLKIQTAVSCFIAAASTIP